MKASLRVISAAVRAGAKRRRLLVIGAAAIVLIALLPAGASAVLSFKAHSDFTVGTEPYSVAVGDFNADGKKDLAVANYSSNTVSVLLGTGSGAFGTATDFGVGVNPSSVTVSDLNGDGKQDLAVTNVLSSSVSVLLGTDAGSFGAATNFSVGTYPYSVAVGDFNGDGRRDLAVANYGSSSVSVLLGQSSGSLFGAKTDFSTGTSTGSYSVAVGDFNADGRQDLAVANYTTGNVSVLLGTGTSPLFATASGSPFGVGTWPTSVAVGDFNADGRQDLAIANANSSYVSILRGTGTGSFETTTDFSLGTNPRSIAVGDFNADGRQDLVTANFNSNNVSVLPGTGTSSLFGAATNFSVGTSPYSVAVGDFNADGRHDLVTANYGSDNVSVLLNAPTATPNPTSLSFGSAGSPVPQGTVSVPQPLTVTNNGTAPLVVLGFAFGGSYPDDFFIGTDTCGDKIAPGSNCTVQVRFAPQAQGSRSATLTVLSNAPSSTPVVLTGTAGPLPQGSAGTNGTNGATGATGPQGKSGQIQLVTCKVVKVKVKGKTVKRKKCTSKLVSGTVKFTTASAVRRATLTRGSVLYATGIVTKKGLVLNALRPVKAGRYTLTLRYWQGKTRVTARSQILIH